MMFGRPQDFFLSSLHLPLIVSSSCLLATLVGGGLLRVFSSRIGILMACFTAWLVLSIPTSVWKGGSYLVVTDQWFKSFAAFVVVGGLVVTLPQCAKALNIVAYAFAAASVLAFFFSAEYGGRLAMQQGMYAGANELATAMVQGLIFCWFLTHNPKRSGIARMLSILCFLPLVIILGRTASRAAFVALALTLPFVFLRYSVRGKAAFLLLVSTGMVATFAVMPESSRKRLFTLFEIEGSHAEISEQEANAMMAAQASSKQRLEVLKASLLLTLEHPVFGVGPGQFITAEHDLAIAQGRTKGIWLGTHNTYTEISSEAGIPALAFYVACMVACWRELRRAERFHQRGLVADSGQWAAAGFTLRLSLVNYGFFFFFEHIAYSPFLPSLAGLIFAYASATRKLANETAPQAAQKPVPALPAFAAPPLPSR